MRKLISVTKEDIKLGLRKHSSRCPIALAIGRTLNANYVGVGVNGTEVCDTANDHINVEQTKVTKIPESVRKFVKAFDQQYKVKPFKFYLELP